MSQWKSTTGLEWNFNYQGTTTASDCNSAMDGLNVVDASSGCADPNCDTLGTERAWYNPSTNVKLESDVCIWGGASNYSTRTDTVSSIDVISVLVHEFGHVIGLGHDSHTVMNATAYSGSVKSRFPTYDDIEGVRSVFPGTPSYTKIRKWKKRTGVNSWGSAYDIPSANQWLEISGALGRTSNLGDVVVVSGTNPDSTLIRFSRATYPLTSTSSWPNVNWSYSTWRRPAISSSGYNNKEWVAAITNPALLNSCSGIRVFRSTTGFTSGSVVNLSSECTNHAPALGYDYNSNRFILLYLQKADSGWQNRIIARTSTDGGFTWTAAQDLGISSIDTPSISCKPGTNECLMTYMLSNSDGQGIVRRRATVSSSTGVITLGDWGVNSNWIQRPPMAGYSTNYEDWILGMMHPSSEAMRANGQGNIYTTTGSTMSGLFGSWSASIENGVTLPANLITADIYNDDYVIYTAY